PSLPTRYRPLHGSGPVRRAAVSQLSLGLSPSTEPPGTAGTGGRTHDNAAHDRLEERRADEDHHHEHRTHPPGECRCRSGRRGPAGTRRSVGRRSGSPRRRAVPRPSRRGARGQRLVDDRCLPRDERPRHPAAQRRARRRL
ncbi:unnamed protein product, partial [Penicillium discolor]